MAEVYWDLEWTLQQQGFDYAYDKRLYRPPPRGARATGAVSTFDAGPDYQNKSARFLENHDEPRAAATFPAGTHEAAAVITFLSPGLRFFHQGQFEGRRKRDFSAPGPCAASNPTDQNLRRLLRTAAGRAATTGRSRRPVAAARLHAGLGRELDLGLFPRLRLDEPAWDRLLVVVNYAPNQSQCYVRLPRSDQECRALRFEDQMGAGGFDRDRADLDADVVGFHIYDPGEGDSSRGLFTGTWKGAVRPLLDWTTVEER